MNKAVTNTIIILLAVIGNSIAQNEKKSPRLPGAVIIAEALAGKLVSVDQGSFQRHSLDPEKAIDHFLFYYSANWSPNCLKFTPELIKFYTKAKKEAANFEVIFVSRDDSEKEMLDYMIEQKMPWPAIRFEDLTNLRFLKEVSGRGVPSLAVLDSRGLILAQSYKGGTQYIGPDSPLQEFQKLIGSKENEPKN
ncbi:MAG: thioredoxin-like domain-containing protein [Verrucomicrobiales bacterium]|nr:thioredoxin-like domain-containing protein [Verrucomicrobiales bacterium]